MTTTRQIDYTQVHPGRLRDAKLAKYKMYTGSACKICGNGIRRTSTGSCVMCENQKAINRYHSNVDKYKEANRNRWNQSSAATKMHRRRGSDARREGVPFDITIEDIHIPDICPVLGIPIISNASIQSDNSPSLDRFIPDLGYVRGNIHVISTRANRIKNNATTDEIEKLLKWMKLHDNKFQNEGI